MVSTVTPVSPACVISMCRIMCLMHLMCLTHQPLLALKAKATWQRVHTEPHSTVLSEEARHSWVQAESKWKQDCIPHYTADNCMDIRLPTDPVRTMHA